jgi:hypothetical protein
MEPDNKPAQSIAKDEKKAAVARKKRKETRHRTKYLGRKKGNGNKINS